MPVADFSVRLLRSRDGDGDMHGPVTCPAWLSVRGPLDFREDTLYEETSFTIEAKLVFGLLYLLDDMLKERLCKLYWLLWFASFAASRARFLCA